MPLRTDITDAAINLGLYPDIEVIVLNGRVNGLVAGVPTQIWPTATAKSYLTAATQLELLSSSANGRETGTRPRSGRQLRRPAGDREPERHHAGHDDEVLSARQPAAGRRRVRVADPERGPHHGACGRRRRGPPHHLAETRRAHRPVPRSNCLGERHHRAVAHGDHDAPGAGLD